MLLNANDKDRLAFVWLEEMEEVETFLVISGSCGW